MHLLRAAEKAAWWSHLRCGTLPSLGRWQSNFHSTVVAWLRVLWLEHSQGEEADMVYQVRVKTGWRRVLGEGAVKAEAQSLAEHRMLG